MRDPRRVAVLISGRGSNMRALVEQSSGYEIVLVASNKPLAAGLDWARSAGIPTWCWDSKGVPREAFDAALTRALQDHEIGTVALAGYMRLLSPGGSLITCSCSYNISEELFGTILHDASVDSRVPVTVVEKRMQGRDHPVLLGVPETYYLKCFILRRVE
jgi:hypothetical protein